MTHKTNRTDRQVQTGASANRTLLIAGGTCFAGLLFSTALMLGMILERGPQPQAEPAATKTEQTPPGQTEEGKAPPPAAPRPKTTKGEPAETAGVTKLPVIHTESEVQRPAEVTPPPATPRATEAVEYQPRLRRSMLQPGMTIAVRLDESLSTDSVEPGHVFTASLAAPIYADGLVVAERGSRVQGRIDESRQGGRVSGNAAMTLQLTNLQTHSGKNIDFVTDPIRREAKTGLFGKILKTALGAGAGFAAGRIAGGDTTMALVGAGTGAGAGLAWDLSMRGKPIKLPAETRLEFVLAEPVTVAR